MQLGTTGSQTGSAVFSVMVIAHLLAGLAGELTRCAAATGLVQAGTSTEAGRCCLGENIPSARLTDTWTAAFAYFHRGDGRASARRNGDGSSAGGPGWLPAWSSSIAGADIILGDSAEQPGP